SSRSSKLTRFGRASGRAARNGLRGLGFVAVGIVTAVFVLWDADWWVLRDKIEHVKAAMFGEYVPPQCRRDPESCETSDNKRPRTKQEACAEVPGLKLHCTLYSIVEDMNRELFGGRLPPAVITLQRKKGAGGYYWHKRFKRLDGQRISEIAINPSYLRNRSMRSLASVLAHELVHQEQAYFGKPSPGGFHNIEWAMMMRRIGLIPSSTGQPGGGVTGTRMSHYIKADGRFDRFAKAHPMIAGQAVPMFE
ncbi:MAG: SprT-like domain-containing protein, partial [Pseudomonadota bacterium]